jgi:hypothetical protein
MSSTATGTRIGIAASLDASATDGVQPTAAAKFVAAPFQSGSAPAGHIVWRRGELLVELLRGNSRRFEMNPFLMVYFSTGATFAGLGLLKLQARLEQWDYQRHAED